MPPLLRHAADLRIHPVPDGYIASRTSTGAVHRLNGTAALVLELCGGGVSVDEVVALMQARFRLSAAGRRSVRDLVDGLLRSGLVVVSAGEADAGGKRPSKAGTSSPSTPAPRRRSRGR
jgi:Coenzyme PQQ synthesis protein D (PqqD)